MFRLCTIIGILMVCSYSLQAITYASARLQAIATCLHLSGIDTLREGETTHYSYRTHPLSIRINKWNEIEHIGLKLFDEQQKQSAIAYDFIERFFLECDLMKGTEAMIRLDLNHVKYLEGNAETVFSLTGAEQFTLSRLDQKAYAAEWTTDDHTVLSFSFDMDYQLLSGCSLIELEQGYLPRLKRYQIEPQKNKSVNIQFPDSTSFYIEKGNSFILDKIHNDCYYQKEGNEWHLIIDSEHPSRSIANIVQNSEEASNYILDLTLDRYGYQSSKDTICLANWLEYCRSEGCHPYFGMKQKHGSNYEGTIFMVNETSGYLHMLSIVFPLDVLQNQKGTIEGRLFVYIPIHNVTEQFFNNTFYKQIEDETTNSSAAMDDSMGDVCTAN